MKMLRLALAATALCAGCAFVSADTAAADPEPAPQSEPTSTSTPKIVRIHRTGSDVVTDTGSWSGIRATGVVLLGVAIVAGVAFLLIRPRR